MSSSRENSARADAVFSRYLRSGVRSTREALAYLRRRGVSSDVAMHLVKISTSHGLLDDGAAARLCAEHFVRQGYAAAAIHQKLLTKGFDEALIAQALSRCAPRSTEASRARAIAARRVRGATGPEQAARLTRTLAAKGYDVEVIEQVVSERFERESTESIN